MNESKNNNKNNDDYLWDKSGEPDPEVQELENLLSRFAHDGRELGQRDGEHPRWHRIAVAAAVILMAAIAGLYGYTQFQEAGHILRVATDVRLVAVDEGRLLHENEWFDATASSRKLRLENSETWLGEFTLDPGSRLQARQIRDELAQLYLHKGRMEAFVYLDAQPRFVQTATPATNCVDLGCEYVLTVDETGDSVVEVTMGRVAFEDNGREVYVPYDATCRASKAHGAGTPRYLDAPQRLLSALDVFDSAHDTHGSQRLELCKKVLAAVPTSDRRHCLSVFHFLQDREALVAEAAREWLVTHVVPRSLQNNRSKMKDYLETNYWWK